MRWQTFPSTDFGHVFSGGKSICALEADSQPYISEWFNSRPAQACQCCIAKLNALGLTEWYSVNVLAYEISLYPSEDTARYRTRRIPALPTLDMYDWIDR